MLQYNVFPGGVKKVVTFSFDDGAAQDERLVALFNKYGVRGTFHINTRGPDCLIGELSEENILRLRKIYEGHEISCHTASHGWGEVSPCETLIFETMQNRYDLERIAGYPVCGMSYPFGTYSREVIDVMRSCGIVYSRTATETKGFAMPRDFMEWHPTCHHSEAREIGKRFKESIAHPHGDPLMYIWGHASEYTTEEKWRDIEATVASLAHLDGVWYATNMEVCEYVSAQRALIVSADEKIIKNPSSFDVWVERDRETVCIPARSTVIL